MPYADHRSFRHLRVADRQILDFDRRYPFAARLDHVLRAIGDLHVALRIDGRDVAGVEEAVGVEDVAALTFEIGLGYGRSAHLEAAEGLAVPRQLAVRIVGD